jgi:hypothetical protein
VADEATAPADEADPAADSPEGEGGGGVSGLIASLQDGVMQVQEADSQTAVTWTDETVFTQTVTVAVADVAVGSCVVAVLPAESDDADADSAVATSVIVSEPVDGECSAGFAGGMGGFPGGDVASGDGSLQDLGESSDDGAQDGGGRTRPTDMPEGEMPEGMPTDMPTGMPGGDLPGAFGQMVAGLVTAVADGVLTVAVTDTEGAASSETVATSADTVVTTTAAADETAVVVGRCASARGETDERGGMTATSVTLSDATDGECTSGFGGMTGLPGREQAGGGTDD